MDHASPTSLKAAIIEALNSAVLDEGNPNSPDLNGLIGGCIGEGYLGEEAYTEHPEKLAQAVLEMLQTRFSRDVIAEALTLHIPNGSEADGAADAVLNALQLTE